LSEALVVLQEQRKRAEGIAELRAKERTAATVSF
jgi:hypothetical protein